MSFMIFYEKHKHLTPDELGEVLKREIDKTAELEKENVKTILLCDDSIVVLIEGILSQRRKQADHEQRIIATGVRND